MGEPIGIIAGGGRLPIAIAEGMRAAGREVCVLGLRGHYSKEIVAVSDRFATVGTLRLGSWIRRCRQFGVHEAVLVGRVDKARMHDPLRIFKNLPDLRAINIWYRRLRNDRRSATLLRAVADDLAQNGVTLIDSTTYITDHLATAGVLTRTQPSALHRGDIELGWPVVLEIAEMQIGQAITVRDRDIIAVEAVEGTDGLINRTHQLCPKKGWTLIKTASRSHDMRADVPTIGVKTIEMLKQHGASCLAVGAGRVILLDKPQVIEAADKAGIAIVGIEQDGPVSG